jgi:hypothetical protein
MLSNWRSPPRPGAKSQEQGRPSITGEPGKWSSTVTVYLLQQIQLLAHRDRHGFPTWSPTGNRSAKPAFKIGYEVRRAQH